MYTDLVCKAVINHEYCDRIIKIVNREDDAGVEGLREAKESYFPLELLKKYKIVSKKNI